MTAKQSDASSHSSDSTPPALSREPEQRHTV